MSPTKSQRWRLRNVLKASCGCRPAPTDVVEPQPKGVKPHQKRAPSTSPPMISGDTLAVVKDSDDPYGDFRQSMLEMTSQKEIYSVSELQQLLHCFLELNLPHHRDTIVRAFIDVWNGGEEIIAPPFSAV